MTHVLKLPLGFFTGNQSGRLRKLIDHNAGLTEDLLAHKLPDLAATAVTPIAAIVVLFLFDWRMGLLCLLTMVLALLSMCLMMGGKNAGFFHRYQKEIERMSGEAVEYSALMIHPELLQNEPSVLLMDIGGWTVDLMRLDNNVPNAATCRSLELGMIRCIDEVKEQVRRDVGLSVTDAQVERVLAGKPCSMDEDARGIIQKQGRLYTERLLSAAMEAGFDLKAIPVVMLGGGAAVVKRNVAPQDGLCRVFALLDDRVNAEGFERILGRLSGGVGKG